MKKIISLILIGALAFSTLALSGCGKKDAKDEETLNTKIEYKVLAYMTDLNDSVTSLTDNDKIEDYLLHWAESKSVDAESDRYGNVIMSVDGTEMYRDAPPVVVVCQYSASALSQYIPTIAEGLYLAKNAVDYGNLTVIFSPESNRNFEGISHVSSRYFSDDAQVFCLNPGQRQMWSFNSGSSSSYKFTGNVSYTAPSGDVAYRISIDGLPGGIPDSGISGYPNPIKELGDLLASLKTNAVIFELADIDGGTGPSVYPVNASATIVVDSNDTEKVEKRLNSAIEKLTDKYSEDYPDMTYTFVQTDLPGQVFTKDSLNDFISTLYTIVDGVYLRDDSEDLISITSLGMLHCEGNSWTASAIANSLTEESLADIDNTYETICSLADIRFEKTGNHAGWSADSDTEFADSVAKAFEDYSDATMTFRNCVAATSAAYVYEKNPDCSIVNVTMNESRVERYTGTIVTFMENLPHTDKSAE